MTDIYEANGARFIAKDDMIVRWLRRGVREFEPQTTAWLFERIAERSGAFLDIGASTGWFAVPAAMRGADVIAFEPNARVQERLLQNCALNGVSITLHKAAASDAAGEATFWYNRILPLTSGGSVADKPTSDALSETVPTLRVDDAVDVAVGVIKIDVEGHEMAVLRGAEWLIGQFRPDMVLEANTDAHMADLAGWLDAHGYTWTRADERNMLCRAS